jgi:hypothetical protein
LSLVRERYADFGPTLAAEKLAEIHGCTISRETLRGWMIAAGLWVDRRHRLPSPHQPRRRRDCLGERVQIDGSEHAWFEDRAAKCTLLAFVDDATGRLMHLRFVASESTFDYFRSTRCYLETHGQPVVFYSDKHGIFRVNAKDPAAGDGATQFGRALTELNIGSADATRSPSIGGASTRRPGRKDERTCYLWALAIIVIINKLRTRGAGGDASSILNRILSRVVRHSGTKYRQIDDKMPLSVK